MNGLILRLTKISYETQHDISFDSLDAHALFEPQHQGTESCHHGGNHILSFPHHSVTLRVAVHPLSMRDDDVIDLYRH